MSDWTWVTSDSQGISVDFGVSVGTSISSITLRHPNTGAQKFHFFEVTAGVGFGYPISLAGSSEDFFSDGTVYMLPSFEGNELQSKDIEGFCIAKEISGAIGVGHSAKAMFVGISTFDFIKGSLFDPSSNAPALILSRGNLAGSVGLGATINSGYLWGGKVIPDNVTLNLLASTEEQEFPVSSRSTANDAAPPIILPGDVLFNFNKSDFSLSGITALVNAGIKLKSYSGRHIQVQGFADSIGSNAYNLNLSLKRATAVKQWLVFNQIVKENNISAKGYGEDYPVASNYTAKGRATNRRVEIHILRARP